MNKYLRRVYASNWVSSVLAGVMLGFSFSPFDHTYLLIPAFMLLLRITDRSLNVKQAIFFTLPAFLIWNSITSYWLLYATVAGGIGAISANALIMTLPMALIHRMRRAGFSVLGGAVIVSSVWVMYEFLHFRWDLAWPWLTVGNAFSNYPELVQFVSLTGSMGISFWVVMSAALLLPARYVFVEPTLSMLLDKDSDDIEKHIDENTTIKLSEPVGFWKRLNPVHLALIILPPAVSFGVYTWYEPEPISTIEIVVAQPNYDSYLPDAGYSDTSIALEELIELTRSAITPNTRAVYWPENAIMIPLFQGRDRYPSNRLSGLAREWNAPIISGVTWYRYYTDEELPPVYRTNNLGQHFNVYNAAAGFMPDGSVEVYKKAKLVPVVERFPFIDILVNIPLPWIDWASISGYGRGTEMKNFVIQDTSSPALVCYDSVFPDLVRSSVFYGAGFLTVVTNDGWWGETSGHRQHFDFARLRAIETRRAVIRSANNGISGLIDPMGRVVKETDYWVQTAFAIDVPVNENITFYVKYGDWIGWGSLFMTIIALVWIPSAKNRGEFLVD
jgi:apolipoprotein N-acyltransferase